MKKVNYQKIIIIIVIVILCLILGYKAIKSNYTKPYNSIMNDPYEEINLGDPFWGVNTPVPDAGKCTSACIVTGITEYNSISNGDSRSVSVSYSSCCSGKQVCIGSNCSSSITGDGAGSKSITITASGNPCQSASSYQACIGTSCLSKTYNVRERWNYYHYTQYIPSYSSAVEADMAGSDEFANGCRSTGDGWYYCDTIAYRCKPQPTTPPPTTPSPTETPVITTPPDSSKVCCYNPTSWIYEGMVDKGTCSGIEEPSTSSSNCRNVCYRNKSTGQEFTWAYGKLNEPGWENYEYCSTPIVTDEPVITPPPVITSPPTPVPTPTPTPEPYYCYGNQPYIGIATNVQWVQPSTASRLGLNYIYSSVSQSSCKVLPSSNSCVEGDIKPAVQNVSANECEDTVSFDVNASQRVCASGSSSFYSISCNNHITTDFDYEADGVKNSTKLLYKGQGFKFEIGVKSTLICKAEFNSSNWLSAYNKVMNKLKTVKSNGSSRSAYDAYRENSRSSFDSFINNLRSRDGLSDNTVSLIYELHTLAKAIEGIVTSYNNYSIENAEGNNANFEISYAKNGEKNNTTYSYQFENSKNVCTDKKTVKKKHDSIHSTVSWLTAPQDYEYKNEKLTYLYPKEIFLDKTTGEETKKESNRISGGNRIMLDKNTNKQKINNIKITVSGLASNNSTVTNNKCVIDVDENKLLYRPVEVSNPFIDNAWEKGKNWSNSTYDFTSTIHANTWSESSLYTIDLTSDMISAIRESNKNNKDNYPYLGLCNRQDVSLQDAITKKLCSLIK